MTQDDLFKDWERRAKAVGRSLSDVRELAGVHAPNFSNWRNGKGGMTLASIQKIEAAVSRLEAENSSHSAAA